MTENEAIVVLQKIKPIPHRGDSKSTTHILETIALDMAIKALEALDKLDSIIVEQLDESTDQKECMTLRWVLDKMSEVTPNG
jgi:hypothetical protein